MNSKKILAIFLSFIMIFSVVGCSNDSKQVIGNVETDILMGNQDDEEISSFLDIDDIKEICLKIASLSQYVEEYFFDDDSIDKDTVKEDIYKGMIEGLTDKYSVYYTADEYKKLQESVSGQYYGIGVVVSQDKTTNYLKVARVFDDTPASEAGILAGDIFVSVNNEEVTDLTIEELVSRMKGKEGTKLHLEMYREGETSYLEFDLKTRKIDTPTISHQVLDDNIGYMYISSFDTVTAKQFTKALDDLDDQNIEGLIIDLRDNGGGSLKTVVNMLDRMLPEGTIVTVKDKNGNEQVYSSTAEEEYDKPLVVLVNENSASASEIFTAAIKDYEVGTIVGTKTYGKGVVQTIFPFEDGSAMKITTAKYYTPKGICIDGDGIIPDIKVELDEELLSKSVITLDEDNQLQRAIEVLKQKMN